MPNEKPEASATRTARVQALFVQHAFQVRGFVVALMPDLALVDALPHFPQSLLLTEQQHVGAVHWCLTRTGEVRNATVPCQTNGPAPGHSSNSPAITPEANRHWVFQASVADGPRFANYVNGELVGGGTRGVATTELGRIESGNRAATGQTPGMEWAADNPAWSWNRGLNGRMGEFALLARAMSAEEIHKPYEEGRSGGGPTSAAEFPNARQGIHRHIHADEDAAPTRAKVGMTTRLVNSQTTLELPLRAAGGQAV